MLHCPVLHHMMRLSAAELWGSVMCCTDLPSFHVKLSSAEQQGSVTAAPCSSQAYARLVGFLSYDLPSQCLYIAAAVGTMFPAAPPSVLITDHCCVCACYCRRCHVLHDILSTWHL